MSPQVLFLTEFSLQAIGNTTSGCYSPVLGKGLVFAYVPAIVDVPGNQVGKLERIHLREGPGSTSG